MNSLRSNSNLLAYFNGLDEEFIRYFEMRKISFYELLTGIQYLMKSKMNEIDNYISYESLEKYDILAREDVSKYLKSLLKI